MKVLEVAKRVANRVTVLGNMRLSAGGQLKRARRRATSVKKQQA